MTISAIKKSQQLTLSLKTSYFSVYHTDLIEILPIIITGMICASIKITGLFYNLPESYCIRCLKMKEILIVDDEEQIRTALKHMLEKEGYTVREASNGDVALRLHREKQADLIVTDIIMPEKEGLGTILELKNEFPGAKIFAMSGGGKNSPEQYLRMAKGFGVDKIFVKPFSREELVSAVKEILS